MAVDLSVVFGTYNRYQLLTSCLSSVRKAAGKLAYEIIVIDGGSTDGTLEFLHSQPNIVLIEHGKLLGPVKAYNDGFHRAQGDFVAYINDDLVLAPGTFEAACKMLSLHPRIGIISIPYRNNDGPVVSMPSTAGMGRRFFFASFGVLRRMDGERMGWFTNRYHHYYGDCTLSVNLQLQGFTIEALPNLYALTHYAADNAVRGEHRWNDPDCSLRADGFAYQEFWKEKG